MTAKYVAGQGSGEAAEAEKAFVSLNWVLAEDVFDVETQLEWGFLDYLLLGTSAAPLRKVSRRGARRRRAAWGMTGLPGSGVVWTCT